MKSSKAARGMFTATVITRLVVLLVGGLIAEYNFEKSGVRNQWMGTVVVGFGSRGTLCGRAAAAFLARPVRPRRPVLTCKAFGFGRGATTGASNVDWHRTPRFGRFNLCEISRGSMAAGAAAEDADEREEEGK